MPTPLHPSQRTAAAQLPGLNAPAATSPDLGDLAYLRISDVRAKFPVSASTWYSLIRIGLAPAPVKLGSGSFWRAADVRKFLERDPAEISAALAVARDARKAKAGVLA